MFVPPQHLDHFSLRQCAAVIGLFGIITIISYFNELAKLGLLGANVYARASVSTPVSQTTAIQHAGTLHGLDVQELKSVLRSNTTRRHRSTDDVLSVSLHLGKETSYITQNLTQVPVFKHKNTLPNYYTSITVSGTTFCVYNCDAVQQPGSEGLDNDVPLRSIQKNRVKSVGRKPQPFHSALNLNLQGSDKTEVERKLWKSETKTNISSNYSAVSEFIKHQAMYGSAAKVFLYQHELAGYSMRDCFKSKAQEAGLNLLTLPINRNYRPEWEMLSANMRQKYDAVFGGYSFGVCETLDKPCMYFSMVTHPLDRILQVYHYCRKSSVNSLCSFSHTNLTERDLYSFIKNSGNTYFKKLLYYSKHCKLLGTDQVCIQDSKTYFILSPAERKVLLDDILSNLEKWFAVVGLVDHYKDSLKLFEHVLSLDFTKCDSFNHTSIGKYLPEGADFSFLNESRKIHRSIKSMRQKLLKDPKVVQWIYADLAIYDKMVDLYYRQWAVFQELKYQNMTGKHLARIKSKLKLLSLDSDGKAVKKSATVKHDGGKTAKRVNDVLHQESEPYLGTFPALKVDRGHSTYSLKERLRQKKLSARRKHPKQDQHTSSKLNHVVYPNGDSTNKADNDVLASMVAKAKLSRFSNTNTSPNVDKVMSNKFNAGTSNRQIKDVESSKTYQHRNTYKKTDYYSYYGYDADNIGDILSRDSEKESRDFGGYLRLADDRPEHKSPSDLNSYAQYETEFGLNARENRFEDDQYLEKYGDTNQLYYAYGENDADVS